MNKFIIESYLLKTLLNDDCRKTEHTISTIKTELFEKIPGLKNINKSDYDWVYMNSRIINYQHIVDLIGMFDYLSIGQNQMNKISIDIY